MPVTAVRMRGDGESVGGPAVPGAGAVSCPAAEEHGEAGNEEREQAATDEENIERAGRTAP
jgi:hypothetical protein